MAVHPIFSTSAQQNRKSFKLDPRYDRDLVWRKTSGPRFVSTHAGNQIGNGLQECLKDAVAR